MSAVNKIYRLAEIQEKFHQQMAPQQIKVLLTVYKAGQKGISVTSIEKTCQMSRASASRIARLFSDRATGTKAGFGIAEWVADTVDLRIKYLVLRAEGRALVESMIQTIEE